MFLKIVLLGIVLGVSLADKDDKKWVWNENSRSSQGGRSSNPRYNVFEEIDDSRPSENLYYPSIGSSSSISGLQSPQPTVPIYQSSRPPGSTFIPSRPGGVYSTGTTLNNPSYGQGQQYYPQNNGINPESPGILTGPVPSWTKGTGGPLQNFDRCKCAAKFNCNSPGISYGSCDVGKQYCCYSLKKNFGSPIPTKPVHSIENGILVGPGGPVDPIPGAYPRPPKQLGGFGGSSPIYPSQRPFGGNNNGYIGGNGFAGSSANPFSNNRPNFSNNNYAGYRGQPEQNEYSPENGILVGPGGPFDVPNGHLGNFGRSAKLTQKA